MFGRGRVERAIEERDRAWSMLDECYRQCGSMEDAMLAAVRLLGLRDHPREDEVKRAAEILKAGLTERAAEILRAEKWRTWRSGE